MRYREFLGGVHRELQPPTYLEIGVRVGESLALSRAKSIGIDPAFQLREEVSCDLSLFRVSSDEYFARADALAPFHGEPIALAFIDGMHLFEYALRDFLNVERHSVWSTVIVLDDMFPRTAGEAARERQGKVWAGDVYKLLAVLDRYRPDLTKLCIDTDPTGLVLVLGADPTNTVLQRQYDKIIAKSVKPDPQRVPKDVLERVGAVDPQHLLDAPLLKLLRTAHAGDVDRVEGMKDVNRSIREDLGVAQGRGRPSRRNGLLRWRRA